MYIKFTNFLKLDATDNGWKISCTNIGEINNCC